MTDIVSPTLIVGGGSTSHIPQDKLREVSELIPHCELVTIEGAGHGVHFVNAAEFLDVVTGFLDMWVEVQALSEKGFGEHCLLYEYPFPILNLETAGSLPTLVWSDATKCEEKCCGRIERTSTGVGGISSKA